MALWDHYHLPGSVADALGTLAGYNGAARLVAGGTDLLLELQQGRQPPVTALVDVTRIPELTTIAAERDRVTVGAAVTHTQIVASALLAGRATCLVESCGVIGGPQVRNVATLGGNVAHALPAGDGTLSLVALEAEAEVATLTGAQELRRAWRPVQALFVGPGKSALDHARELIVRFRFTLTGLREATAYKRIMRPQGVALPILALAAWARLDPAGERFESARVALGPAGPTPLRAQAAETFLAGKPADTKTIRQTVPLVLEAAHLRTSPHRASGDYRRELVPVLVERALALAVERARSGEATPEGLGLA